MESCSGTTLGMTTDDICKALPYVQPQEGSPANTSTESELQALQESLRNYNINPVEKKSDDKNVLDILGPWNDTAKIAKHSDDSREMPVSLYWYGAPQFTQQKVQTAREFREIVRQGNFTGPTNGVCPGFLQCNLVVLPQGEIAFDFLLFCQRNPQACPLLEVCDVGSATPHALAPTANLKTDCPRYAIYRNGELEKVVVDATDYWPENSVAFLIGCSFSYDNELLNAGIPLRSAEQGKNVPMYRTNLKCRPAGSLHGNMVVSMKPIPALQVSKHVEITAKYQHAHGEPICIGCPDVIGVKDLTRPDWGEAVNMRSDEVPVFHACGVTPQNILMESKVPFAITHAAGHMFVTDMPAEMGASY